MVSFTWAWWTSCTPLVPGGACIPELAGMRRALVAGEVLTDEGRLGLL